MTGRNLFAEIELVLHCSLTGPLKRYKAKKWKWLGSSDTPVSDHKNYEIFAADFNDMNNNPYTFFVAVDTVNGRIEPVEDLDETAKESIYEWLDRLGQGNQPLKTETNPNPEKTYSVWLGQVTPSPHPWLDSEIPRLLLGSSAEEPLTQIKNFNEGLISGSVFTSQFPIKPRPDLLDEIPRKIFGQPSYRTKKGVSEQKKRIKKYLIEEKGFIIDLNNGNTVHTVYVVNLSDKTGPRVNPHRWVYVGQTSKTPEERRQQHLAGENASRHVRKYGEDLNYRLFSSIPQVRFRQDAETLESLLAEDLEKRGFNVKGGH